MRTFALLLLAGTFLSGSALLAQEEFEESRPVLKHRTAERATVRDWHREQIFACARKHPLSPRDIEMRDAVSKLGANRHRFVRLRLRDGSAVVGGITFIGQETFSVTQGISGGKQIPYRSLESAPKSDAAPAEHLANGLKWTGVVAVCVIAVPVVLVMLPFSSFLAD